MEVKIQELYKITEQISPHRFTGSSLKTTGLLQTLQAVSTFITSQFQQTALTSASIFLSTIKSNADCGNTDIRKSNLSSLLSRFSNLQNSSSKTVSRMKSRTNSAGFPRRTMAGAALYQQLVLLKPVLAQRHPSTHTYALPHTDCLR